MNEQEWPEWYPEQLKDISWNVENGKVAGVNNYWNKYLPTSAKSSRLFVKTVMLDIFYDHGVPVEVGENYIEWIIKRFTFCMTEDDNEFRISRKKDKNKKPLFDKNEYYEMAKKEIGFNKTQANQMLRYLLQKTKDIYDHCE